MTAGFATLTEAAMPGEYIQQVSDFLSKRQAELGLIQERVKMSKTVMTKEERAQHRNRINELDKEFQAVKADMERATRALAVERPEDAAAEMPEVVIAPKVPTKLRFRSLNLNGADDFEWTESEFHALTDPAKHWIVSEAVLPNPDLGFDELGSEAQLGAASQLAVDEIDFEALRPAEADGLVSGDHLAPSRRDVKFVSEAAELMIDDDLKAIAKDCFQLNICEFVSLAQMT